VPNRHNGTWQCLDQNTPDRGSLKHFVERHNSVGYVNLQNVWSNLHRSLGHFAHRQKKPSEPERLSPSPRRRSWAFPRCAWSTEAPVVKVSILSTIQQSLPILPGTSFMDSARYAGKESFFSTIRKHLVMGSEGLRSTCARRDLDESSTFWSTFFV
jgi:hypothetical protein